MIQTSQIERWLAEDLGHHDVTNEVTGETTGRLVARASGVAAGVEPALSVFEYLDVDATAAVEVGTQVTPGDVLLEATGEAQSVLRGERVVVNVVGHASGVATATRRAVDRARAVDDDVRVAATRKTTPGLRGLEKRAVVAGGGDTHRLDLSHMVLIKENHIAQLGFEAAIERFRERSSFATNIEVEVERPEDGKRAAAAGADIVLFDNLSPKAIARGVELLPAGTLSEASGGITVDTVSEYAGTGVDVISMGSLTHSAPTLDYSFLTD